MEPKNSEIEVTCIFLTRHYEISDMEKVSMIKTG